MKLNVIGTTLLPFIPDCSFTDEEKPLCITVTDAFRDWTVEQGLEEHIAGVGVGQKTKLAADVWITAYKDGVAPPISAKHSHERAVYWFPLELFDDLKDETWKSLP